MKVSIFFLFVLAIGNSDYIRDTSWVLVQFDDPITLKKISIPESDYINNCAFKYVIHFGVKKGQFTTTINDKFVYKGKYELRKDGIIRIYSRISPKVVDTEQKCHVDSESRIAVAEIFRFTVSYEIKSDTLILKHHFEQDGFAYFKIYTE